MIISSEDLASKTQSTLREIFSFLGLPIYDIKNTEKEGEVISFYYYQKGEKIVTLNVTDIFGNSKTDTLLVEVSR